MDSNDNGTADNDIAIVAVALRVPGARDPERFWQNVCEGVESVRSYSDDELSAAGVSSAELSNPNYVRAGAPLDGMDLFDAEFFGFGPKEAAIMDPQHRQFLECCWEALERAGQVPSRFEGAIGVFAGCGMGSYFAHNILSNRDLVESVGLFLLRHTGNDKDFLATRASYCLDLRGPSVNVQTACSTSLVAVHLACQSLLSGECDMALAGGVTIEIPHRQGYLYHEGEILAPDGHCRPFDHRAQGTVFGSGTGVVVLRRLADAIADGDAIVAVVKGSAVNNDGSRKVGYLAPSVDGQAAAVAEALSIADVSADSIGLIECHGTGTAMGDPIEIAALTQAFASGTERQGYCAVGSIKSNIGHLDTAAGVVALIKAALSLRHGVLPPTLNFERANPQIEFEKTPFYVNTKRKPWPAGRTPRRAGVNSLGVGGTNAYVVLEEPPKVAVKLTAATQTAPALLLLSARNRRSLAGQQQRLLAHLQQHPEIALAELAHTLFQAREHFDVRRVLAVATREDALRLLGDPDARNVYTQLRRERASIVFMFPGGGTQYPRMGAGLLSSDAVYREHIERGLTLAQQRFGLTLRGLLLPPAGGDENAARELERPSLQLPLLFIVEHALAQSWLARGVKPAALIGHSMGENTAACIAGVMDFETTLGLVALRGKLFDSLPEGGMLSVPLSAAELKPLLPDGVVIACENAPSLSVASGPRAALDTLAKTLAARGSEAQAIRIRIAAHSPMLDSILAKFGTYLRGVQLSAPRIPIISNVTGELLRDSDATDPEYWVRHLRNTVRFERGIATLEADSGRVYLEVGPGRALGSLVRQCLDPQANAAISSLRRPDETIDDQVFFLAALGRLWASGADVDLASVIPNSARRVLLPTYAFDHKPYFITPGKLAAFSGGRSRIPAIEDWFFHSVWRWRELEPDELSGPGQQTYLLFADELGVADRVALQLQAAGHRTVFVRKSGAYGQTDLFEYEVAPHAPHSYATLVQELAASEKLPDRILHLWSLDTIHQADAEPEWRYDPADRKLTFDSLFHLMHALASQGVVKPAHLTVVTAGAVRLMAEPLPHPEQALVKGICQVIPRESPNLSATWVDLPLPRRARSWLRAGQLENLTQLAGWLENEARSQRRTGTIAYRDGRRFEQDQEAMPRTAAAHTASRLHDRGVYAITGGLGGIGLAIARHLAKAHAAMLLLIARTALPPRDEWSALLESQPAEHPLARRIAAVRELEALGAEVEVAQADVANLEQMRGALASARARFGRVHGVFHAAGVLDDRLLALKTLAEADEILRPKLDGTWVLHQLSQETAWELLVLFSSTSVLIGPPGQADYVAANAFMDAYAESRRGKPGPLTIAIQWGVWRDVGMAAEAARGMRQSQPSRAPSRVQGPFFDTRRDAADGGVTLEGHHAAVGTWWLDDHRLLDGTAVLPGTGYLQLMAVAASELGLRKPFELRDAMFLRPLTVEDRAAKTIRVRVRREQLGYGFEVQSIYSEHGVDMGYITHAIAQASALDHATAPPPLDLAAIRARAALRVVERVEGIRTSQEAHLRFGPRFRCLRKAYFGQGEALGELALDADVTGDVDTTSLHAGLLDLGTGFAMELIPGYSAEQGLWAPLSYRRLQLHAPLPAQCVAWVRLHANAAGVSAQNATIGFDVTLCDVQGGVCVEVSELTLRRVPTDQTLGQLARPAANELEPDPALATVRNKTAPSPAETAFRANLEAGITAREGGPALELALTGHTPSCLTISSLTPRALLQQLDELAVPQRPASARFARPELDVPYVAPSDPLHKEVTEIWEQILGIEGIGIQDGFFELGGHSLTAVRLTAELRKRFGVELGLSALFEAPSIERLSALLAQTRGTALAAAESGNTRAAQQREFTPVVPIKPRGMQRPLFCVAGQGGNPMHLRTLAHYLGAERPFYGLQHRGLDGRSVPYASVEEMASDFITHMQKLDAGPYLIAGYSGGGTAAFEIARQLRAAGKGIEGILLLDSFCPIEEPAGIAWRLRAHLEALQAEGVEYAKRRMTVRLKRQRKRFEQRFLQRPQPVVQSRSMFETAASNWQAIEARYRPTPYDGSAFLFRVNNHDADDARYFAERYGGWNKLFTHGVRSFIVPGTHVSMCEEPNVQVLAEQLRDVLDSLDGAARAAQ